MIYDGLKDDIKKATTGSVILVGAGIGDPDLITVAGQKALRNGDVIVYDALANPKLLEQTREDAPKIYVGKRAGEHRLNQDEINELLLQKAQAGKCVVRLKGGDPYLFGRGAEEIAYLAKRGVKVEMIPGITSGIAGPALAGIPVTHRSLASTVTFITGHEDPTKSDSAVDYAALAKMIKTGGTACFYMGMGKLEKNCAALINGGLDKNMPAAAVQWASLPQQKSVRGTVESIKQKAEEKNITAPAIVIIGKVAGIEQPGLDFFEKRPLFGKTIIVTRSRSQCSSLTQKLQALGANVLEAPTIDIAPSENLNKIDALLTTLSKTKTKNTESVDWLIFTSANTVFALAQRLDALNLDSRTLAAVKISAVGKATNSALKEQLNIAADFIPSRATGKALAEQIQKKYKISCSNIALLRGDLAGTDLPQIFKDAGAQVSEYTIYHTRISDSLPDEAKEKLRQKNIDWITFTSSSTARNMAQLLGDEKALLENCHLASIGEMTSAALSELGLKVDAQPQKPGIDELVEAIVKYNN